jgi:rhodanese-related sulfurtransferase
MLGDHESHKLYNFSHTENKVPIVIYCKSGRRASKAQEVLQSQGYKTVVNGGGLNDLASLNQSP